MTTATVTPDVEDRALALRDAGWTYEAIARQLGLNVRATAHGAANRAARRQGRSLRVRAARVVAQADAAGVPVSARRFGVEIEVVGLSESQAVAALRAAGIRAEHQDYNHRVPTLWKVVYDGSVSGGCEVVSPILQGEAGYEQVRQVMAALKAAGARVDRSTGLHVHHEVVDLTGSEVASLVRLYTGHQDTLDALVSPSRRRNTNYCARLRPVEVERFCSAFESGTDRGSLNAAGIGGRPDSRYRTINVHSYPTYGTIEFRQHQGTLDGRKTVAWIKLGQAMIEAARAAATLGDGEEFLSGLTAHGLDASTRRFLAQRMDALAAR